MHAMTQVDWIALLPPSGNVYNDVPPVVCVRDFHMASYGYSR